MLKFQMSQRKEFREFEFWKFEFASDWSEADASPDIRISDFLTLNSCLLPTMPRLV